MSQSAMEGVEVGMLYEVQDKNVFCLNVWRTWESVPGFGATILKARLPNLSLDRGRNISRFDADLRTVGRGDSVKTGCIKLEMYDGALPLRERWTSKQILYCILYSMGSQCHSTAQKTSTYTDSVTRSSIAFDHYLDRRH